MLVNPKQLGPFTPSNIQFNPARCGLSEAVCNPTVGKKITVAIERAQCTDFGGIEHNGKRNSLILNSVFLPNVLNTPGK